MIAEGDDGVTYDVSTDDPGWYAQTGHCGGCGEEGCHVGPCQGEVCALCLYRHDQGWFCRPGCDASHVGKTLCPAPRG